MHPHYSIVILALLILMLVIGCIIKRNKKIQPCEFSRHCFAQNLTDTERALYMKLVGFTGKLLDANEIPWIPVGGSLLAVYRHNQFMIPWDDDFDMTIRDEDGPRALELLRKEVSQIGATLTTLGRINDWGILHKVHFQKDIPRPGMRTFKNKKYTWPFVDIFIGGTNTGPMGSKGLTEDEFPLHDVIVEDILMKVPSKGPRSYENFLKRDDLMKTAVEQEHSHRFEWACGCIGHMKKSLS